MLLYHILYHILYQDNNIMFYMVYLLYVRYENVDCINIIVFVCWFYRSTNMI